LRSLAHLFQQRLEGHHAAGSRAAGGIIQGPSRLSPYRHPERALERRNLVLDSMVETHAITREQAEKAKATPLKLAPPNVEASDAPYFVDMVRDTLINKFSEHDFNDQSYRIYTTLDPDLQKPPRRQSNPESSWWMSRSPRCAPSG
jgi:penicillin-binding protein 1B